MAVRVLLLVAAFAVLYGCEQASSPVEKQEKKEKQDQAQPPDPKPEKPTLETATLHVAGANGGAYKVTWIVWDAKGNYLHKQKDTGIIQEEPTAYPINLEGFRTDQNKGFFLGHDDLDMEATKTEPWEGDLVIVLEVNNTLVECETMRETYPRANPGGVSIAFDADTRKSYKERAVCANRLES